MYRGNMKRPKKYVREDFHVMAYGFFSKFRGISVKMHLLSQEKSLSYAFRGISFHSAYSKIYVKQKFTIYV